VPLCQPARFPPRPPLVGQAPLPQPMRDALPPPGVVKRSKELAPGRGPHPVARALCDSHRACLQGRRRGAARAASGGDSPPVPRVEGLQPRHRRPLDDVFFPGRWPQGPWATSRLWDGDPLSRWRVRRPPLEPVGPVLQVRLLGLAIGGPRLPGTSGGGLPVETSLRLPEALHLGARGPPRRPGPRTAPRGLTSAGTRLVQGTPALRPAPGLRTRLPLGQLPSLHRRRRGRRCSTTHVVRSCRWDSGAVRLPAPVPHGRAPGWLLRADLAARGPVRCRASRGPHPMCPGLPGGCDPTRSAHPWPSRGGPCGLPRVRSAAAPEQSAAGGAPYPAGTFPGQRCTGTVTGASA